MPWLPTLFSSKFLEIRRLAIRTFSQILSYNLCSRIWGESWLMVCAMPCRDHSTP